jgi:hypothetical protein
METGGIGASPKLEHQHISQTIAETFNLRYRILTGLRAVLSAPVPETDLIHARLPDVLIGVEDADTFAKYLETLPNSQNRNALLQQVDHRYLVVIEVDHKFVNSNYQKRRDHYHAQGVGEFFQYTYDTKNQYSFWKRYERGRNTFKLDKEEDQSFLLNLKLNTLTTEKPAESRHLLESFIGSAFADHQAHMDEKFEAIDKRFEEMDERFDKVERTLGLIVRHLNIKEDVPGEKAMTIQGKNREKTE